MVCTFRPLAELLRLVLALVLFLLVLRYLSVGLVELGS